MNIFEYIFSSILAGICHLHDNQATLACDVIHSSMGEQMPTSWQIAVNSAVPLLVAVVGIIATCIAAKSSAKSEMQKAIVLRFVEMFETAAQGLSTVSDIYANLQIMFSTPMSKESLILRLQTMAALGQACTEAGKTADSAILKLNVYFPNPGHESIDLFPSTSSLLKLIAWVTELDLKMKEQDRSLINDEEYAQYQLLEERAANNLKPLQAYYNARREYFNRCYATWRKKNLSFLKWK